MCAVTGQAGLSLLQERGKASAAKISKVLRVNCTLLIHRKNSTDIKLCATCVGSAMICMEFSFVLMLKIVKLKHQL